MKINNFFNFEKKIVLITGCSGQIGFDMCNFFLELGSLVYGLDLKNIKKIKNKNFFFFKTDITKEKNINNLIKKIFNSHKKIDVIINNAAKSYFSPFIKRTNNEIDNTLNTNIKGPINIIKQYYKFHKKYNSKRCSIINIGSIYGVVSPDLSIYESKDRISSEIYGASKAGLIQLTKYFSTVLAKDNIFVNSISPGGVLNKKQQSRTFIKRYNKRVPLGKMATTFDICLAALYFASDHVNYTTGQNLVIDGGLTAW